MKRIDTSTKSTDKFGAGKHGFTNGNPVTPIPSTQLDETWCDNLQEEIANVVEAAGIVLNGADRTQLLQAIQLFVIGAQKAVILNNAIFEASVSNGEVMRWDSGNSRFDEAVADGTTNNRAVGVADVTNSKVYLYGECALFSGLTPGARYYLDATTPGAVTTTAPADGVAIGIAKSATVLFIDIDNLGVRADTANTWTKGQAGSVAALPATAGTVTLDLVSYNNASGTITGNITLANPSSMPVGQSGVITIINDSTPRTIAYGSYWKPADGVTLPALTATAGANDDLVYYVESATRIVVGRIGGS